VEIEGLSAEQIEQAAFSNAIALYELTPLQASLEEAYMSMTRDDVEYRAPQSHADMTTTEGAIAA
jgi:ABC-2 type transport system ATP-binding protein